MPPLFYYPAFLSRTVFYSLIFLILSLSSLPVYSASLSDIQVNSYLNQPFRATIEIKNLGPTPIEKLLVKLVSYNKMRQMGIETSNYLRQLNFELVPGMDNNAYITITARPPLTEPFLQFALELNTPGGRLIREYSVLLDLK